MADKREAYAGDLTSDVLGKTIRVRTMRGDAVVTAIQHYRDERQKPRTSVWFENGASTLLGETDLVEVLPLTVRGAHLCPVCLSTFNTSGARDGHLVTHRAPAGGDVA
jgi:hypothetical protein